MPHPNQYIPAYQAQFMFNPKYEKYRKHYKTVKQTNASLANDGIITLIAGRGLGGGSTINGLIYNRGSPHDFNSWANLTNDPSWNYANLLPYFRKIENYSGDFGSDQHGYDGPMTLMCPQYAPAKQEWLEAGRQLGFHNIDPNGPQKVSFTEVDFAKKFGRRISAYTGYLSPFLSTKLSNLQIKIHSEATKILFNGTRATGVQYKFNGITYSARATREVILSCGALDTPLLLMKSGIGPRSELDLARIPIVKELPVGQSLDDHPVVPVSVILNNESAVFTPEKDLTEEALNFYNEMGDGPYSTTIGLSGQAFLKSSQPSEVDDWADIHLHNYNLPLQNLAPTVLEKGEIYANWSASVGRPRRRGSVRLNSTDINSDPIIDLNFFDDPLDLQTAADGAKWIMRICETNAFKRLGCRIPGPLPQCKGFYFKSNDYWKCYARHLTETGYHMCGTCKMGRVGDVEAVVDSKLRVIGINGLRVVDASVMPAVVNTNTQSAVYVIAEKAADMILFSAGQSRPNARAKCVKMENNGKFRDISAWNGVWMIPISVFLILTVYGLVV